MADSGVNFPIVEGSGRSSTITGQEILADAARGVDDLFSREVLAQTDWRHTYPRWFGRLLLAEATSSEAALQVARQGLASARERFVFVGSEGDRPLDTALDARGRTPLRTAEVNGHDERVRELVVPYRGQQLRGVALLRQLDDWVHRGIVEPSLADALGAVVRNPEWLDLRDRTVGMIGAGSEMGPCLQLLGWGATVAAVDLPRPAVWDRLVGAAASSGGKLLVPVPADSSGVAGLDAAPVAGADLLADPGLLADWLGGVPGPLTIGNYGYADGAAFVRLTMAFDVLITELLARRDDVSVSYLATPADVFMVPYRAVDMARRRHDHASPVVAAGKAIHAASGGRWFKPNYPATAVVETATERFGFLDAFITVQGPNYALAKRLQRWRMMVTRADGVLTSVHVAPPTRTRSVNSNPLMTEFNWLNTFLGVETFEAATTEALAGGILVHDLRNPSSPANPATPLGHPHEAFMFAANPGGRWRVPFDIASSIPLLTELNHARMRAAGLVGKVGERLPVPEAVADGLSRLPRPRLRRPGRD